jgi:hypothetical protein
MHPPVAEAAMVVRVIAYAVFVMLMAGARADAQDRGGFTALVDVGIGIQNDTAIEETAVGLGGLGFGVGAFLSDNLALMFRLTGTNVNYDLNGVDYGQSSGFMGPAAQFWLSDKLNVEAGAGFGYWRGDNDDDSRGLGLILGAGYSILNRGKHNLQLGVQYLPAFTDPGTVHSFGFTFGYQFQ